MGGGWGGNGGRKGGVGIISSGRKANVAMSVIFWGLYPFHIELSFT